MAGSQYETKIRRGMSNDGESTPEIEIEVMPGRRWQTWSDLGAYAGGVADVINSSDKERMWRWMFGKLR